MNKIFISFSLFFCLFACANAGNIEIQNDYYCYEFSIEDGLLLKKIVNKKVINSNNIFESTAGNEIFSIKVEYPDNKIVSLDSKDFAVLDVNSEKNGSAVKNTILLEAKEKTLGLSAVLTLISDDTCDCIWQITLKSKQKATAYVAMPILQGLKLGNNINDVEYFFPRYIGVMNKVPANLGSVYGQYVRIQMMEAFNNRWNSQSGSGVIYIVCPDESLSRKTFELTKRVPGEDTLDLYDDYALFRYWKEFEFDSGLGMAINFNFLELTPDEKMTLPEVVVGISDQGWKAGFDRYKRWTKDWYHPSRPADWYKVFFVQGSHLFEIDELEQAKQQVRANIDAFSDRFQKPFMHGTYNYREVDWGFKGVKEFVDYVHDKGAQVYAYTNPMYANTNSETYKEFGEKARVFVGDSGLIGFNDPQYCIGYVPFRDYYVKQCVKLVTDLKLEGIYTDCVGWATSEKEICDNPLHAHKSRYYYLNATKELFADLGKAVRAVNSNCAVMTEGPLVDILFNYVDGTYDYNVRQFIQNPNFYAVPVHFLRFLYPDFKFFEITTESPTQAEVLKQFNWCMFNGVGPMGYYLSDVSKHISNEKYMMKLIKILSENEDAFGGTQMDMMLPVLQSGLYANSFAADEKVIYTFFNTNSYDISGEFLRTSGSKGKHFVNLFEDVSAPKLARGSTDIIVSAIKPDGVAVIAELPSLIKVERNGINFKVTWDCPGDAEILINKPGYVEERANLVMDEYNNQLRLSDNDKYSLSVVLFEKGSLKDKVIIPRLSDIDLAIYATVSTSNDKEETKSSVMNAGGTDFGIKEKLSSQNINDGDGLTKWTQIIDKDNWPAWVILKWMTEQEFNTVAIKSEADTYMMQDYSLQYSKDGIEWSDIPCANLQKEKAEKNKEQSLAYSQTLPSNERIEVFQPVSAKYLRLKIITGGMWGGGANISSMEVYSNIVK
ncbi:MAG: discoidin domain-containing protein [Sedimentisphaerales bacterium]